MWPLPARLLGVTTAVVLLAAGCTAPATTEGSTLQTRIDRELRANLDADAIRAILVYHRGHPVLADYRHSSRSAYQDVEAVTMSIVSTLVGTAIRDGYLRGVNQTLGELLPQYGAVMARRMRHTTLERVLTMTGGFHRVWWGVEDPTLRYMTARDPVRRLIAAADENGSRFAFSNAGAHLVAAVLTRATGMSLLAYARTALFDPLGIDTRPATRLLAARRSIPVYERAGFSWPVDRGGTNVGWGLLRLRPDDLAKLGRLYLDHGRWQGRQVVPASWVREATATHVRTDQLADGFGYFWWTGHADGAAAYVAEGYGGQLLEVVPARRLVVVVSTSFDLAAPSNAGVTEDYLLTLVDAVIAPHFRS